MTSPSPPHEKAVRKVVRTGRGGGDDSAQWRMGEGAERRGAGSPEGRPICPLLGPAGPLGVESEGCGAAVTQPAASSSAGSRGRASPAPALCPCPRHPAAPCRSASRPRRQETSPGAAGAARVPCHPPPSPPPLRACCARTAPFPRCPCVRRPRRHPAPPPAPKPACDRKLRGDPPTLAAWKSPSTDLALQSREKTTIPRFPRAIGAPEARTRSFPNAVWDSGAPPAVGVELAVSRGRSVSSTHSDTPVSCVVGQMDEILEVLDS